MHAQSCPALATSQTIAHKALQSMGFPRQEHWSGLPQHPLQGIFPARDQKGISCISCIGRQILLPLSHLGSPLGTQQVLQKHLYTESSVVLCLLLISPFPLHSSSSPIKCRAPRGERGLGTFSPVLLGWGQASVT